MLQIISFIISSQFYVIGCGYITAH